MPHPSRPTILARPRAWLRRNVYLVTILGIFLLPVFLPVFGKSLLQTWGVPGAVLGVLVSLLAGVAGNLIASYIQAPQTAPPPAGVI